MISLDALYRYPIKSTQGEVMATANIDQMGMPDDRLWMVTEENGRMITGRTDPALVLVRVQLTDNALTLNAPDMPSLTIERSRFEQAAAVSVWDDDFQAWQGCAEADAWFSDYLWRPVKLMYVGKRSNRRVENHPDLPLSFADGYPLLLINRASLDDLSARVGREMVVAQFRPNLVVNGALPFAEDGWQRLRIGPVTFRVAKPCARCVFTTIDPVSAQVADDQEPLRTLSTFRTFDDGVMFGVNLIAENAGEISAGMPVEML